MNAKIRHLFTIISVLSILSLSCLCQFNPLDKVKELMPSSVEMGDEYRSEGGGFAFKQLPDYTVEDIFGIVQMMKPGADTEVGPGIIMVGGENETEMTSEELLEKQRAETVGDNTYSNEKKIKIGGVDAISVDVDSVYNGKESKGRIIVAAVSPTQMFLMVGVAPKDEWEELEPLFEAVVDTVTFFEPNPEAIPTVPEPVFEEPTPMSEVVPQPEAPAEPLADSSGFLRQWAIKARASSQYGDLAWSASQATGEPNVNECGDNTLAWASYSSNTVEWIELTYEVPVVPTEINIHQSYSPSQVVEVELITVEGDRYTAWQGVPEAVPYCPDMMTITLDLEKKIMVNRIKITIDQTVMGTSWNEIDAVELVGMP